MEPVDVLEMFSVQPGPGTADFLELTYSIAAAWRDSGSRKPCCAAIVNDMCKQRGTWYRPFYQQMKRAVKPVLDADDETLAALGISLKKHTSSALAYALAELV